MTIIVDNFNKECGLCHKTSKDNAYYFNWAMQLWLCLACNRKNK